MQYVVRCFARAVGAPNVVEPAGFRDFRGWLARLGERDARPIWDQLIAGIARDVQCDVQAVHALKEDVVREIVKCVVVPRPDESAKLVSTNAGRQASRPRSGTTLMVVLEQQLERVDFRLPQLVAETILSSDSDDPHSYSPFNASMATQRPDKLPSVSDILGNRAPEQHASLPSFKELEASLRKNGSPSR